MANFQYRGSHALRETSQVTQIHYMCLCFLRGYCHVRGVAVFLPGPKDLLETKSDCAPRGHKVILWVRGKVAGPDPAI